MGMRMAATFNIAVRQTLRQGKILFEIYTSPFYSGSNTRPAGQGEAAVKSVVLGYKNSRPAMKLGGSDCQKPLPQERLAEFRRPWAAK